MMATKSMRDAVPGTGLAIRVRGVTKEFGTGGAVARALRGVDLDVAYGEMLLLVGPSGCGKTTLVSIIAGTLEPTAGDVEVLGHDLTAMTNGAKVRFRRENVGFVFQSYNLLPALTAAENAAVPLLIAGWRRRDAVEKAAMEELERFIESGPSEDELAAAKTAWLEARKTGRSNDDAIVGQLVSNLDLDRTMARVAADEKKVAALTPTEVRDAFRRHVDPEKLVIIRAGDFAKKP